MTMDNVLFIIDMQEIYAGRGRNKEKYNYDTDRLIDNINLKLAEYKPEEVFYFKSIAKGLGGILAAMPKAGTHEAKFVERLKIVGKNLNERSKPDALSITDVADFIGSRNIKQIELAGVDVNNSISLTAITATNDLNVNLLYNTNCMVFTAPEKAEKMREKFRRNRVTLL